MNRRNFLKNTIFSLGSFFTMTKFANSHNNKKDKISKKKENKSALIIVDVQNDFCPGGSLPVKQGDSVIPIINELQEKFSFVALTQDWHPRNHSSFSSNNPGKEVFSVKDMPYGKQVIWPPHCVIGTDGAKFHNKLNSNKANIIIRKGFRTDIDSYSGFFENDRVTKTGLEGALKNSGIEKVYVVGLALDYCVHYTALDSSMLGFETFVIKEATLPVDIGNSVEETLKNFKKNKVNYLSYKDVF